MTAVCCFTLLTHYSPVLRGYRKVTPGCNGLTCYNQSWKSCDLSRVFVFSFWVSIFLHPIAVTTVKINLYQGQHIMQKHYFKVHFCNCVFNQQFNYHKQLAVSNKVDFCQARRRFLFLRSNSVTQLTKPHSPYVDSVRQKSF